jgi:hypothetical protein
LVTEVYYKPVVAAIFIKKSAFAANFNILQLFLLRLETSAHLFDLLPAPKQSLRARKNIGIT